MPRLSQFLKQHQSAVGSETKKSGITQSSVSKENNNQSTSSNRRNSQRKFRQEDGSLSSQCPTNGIYSQISQLKWQARVKEACLQSGVVYENSICETVEMKHPLQDPQHPFNSWFQKEYNYVMQNEARQRTA